MTHDNAVLQVQGLTRTFGGLAANVDISLAVRVGEVHAIIGPNGAGKTTFIKQLLGLILPDSGHVRFMGGDITNLPVHERVRRGLAYTSQLASVFDSLSVLDNVALAIQAREGHSFYAWRPCHTLTEQHRNAHAILAQVGLAARADDKAAILSHGEQRSLELAMAIATRPALLLLDEPAAGLGIFESQKLAALITTLKQHYAILLVEHDMDLVFSTADTVTVLADGRVIATGTPAQVRQNAHVLTAYLGEDPSEQA